MHVLAIDQGTTGTTTILYDHRGKTVARAYREIQQHYPHPGWVEHDAREIWETVLATVREVRSKTSADIHAIGITNQRETTVVWDQATGKPVHHAIVWQCRRTAEMCEALRDREPMIRDRTGLPLDAYFSGTKLKWILENVQTKSPDSLLFGTIDAWLIWKLTGGKTHATDCTNASRTMLYNIKDHRWDPELCGLLGIPATMLPQVKNPMDDYGNVTGFPELEGIPIFGVAGDQQAALFGQACFSKGQAKNTYGTGCFLLMNTGSNRISSGKGLITTLAADGSGKACYALEGSVFIAGAAIQWLRDELKLIGKAEESEAAALRVKDNAGVYLVPAFVGLGAPHWDMRARGVLTGLTRGANRDHIIRAALESMAFQTFDVLTTMEKETGTDIASLSVDGGACANDFLMQFQSDLLNRPVVRPSVVESTSLGAAFLAGLGAGVWKDAPELEALKKVDREFTPTMSVDERSRLLDGWAHALRQTMVQ